MIIIGGIVVALGYVVIFASIVLFFSGFVHIVLSIYCKPFVLPLASKRDRLRLNYKKVKGQTEYEASGVAEECRRLYELAEDDVNIMRHRYDFHKSEIVGSFVKGVVAVILGVLIIVAGFVLMASNLFSFHVHSKPEAFLCIYSDSK